MKKIILSALAICAFGFANAQEKKEMPEGGKGFSNGDVFISGSLGISSTKTGDVKSSSFTVSPKVGFFVTENIAIGGKLGYTSTKNDNGTVSTTDNTLAIGAFGRYYATPASDFSFFAELGANYSTTKYDTDPSYKVNGFNVALSPGVSYFISSNFALEASIAALTFGSTKPDYDNAEQTTNFGLNVNLSNVDLGLIYKF